MPAILRLAGRRFSWLHQLIGSLYLLRSQYSASVTVITTIVADHFYTYGFRILRLYITSFFAIMIRELAILRDRFSLRDWIESVYIYDDGISHGWLFSRHRLAGSLHHAPPFQRFSFAISFGEAPAVAKFWFGFRFTFIIFIYQSRIFIIAGFRLCACGCLIGFHYFCSFCRMKILHYFAFDICSFRSLILFRTCSIVLLHWGLRISLNLRARFQISRMTIKIPSYFSGWGLPLARIFILFIFSRHYIRWLSAATPRSRIIFIIGRRPSSSRMPATRLNEFKLSWAVTLSQVARRSLWNWFSSFCKMMMSFDDVYFSLLDDCRWTDIIMLR